MSTHSKINSLDIFETQEVLFHIWDVYFARLIEEFGKDKVMNENEHTLIYEKHDGAVISLWYRSPDQINHSCMSIIHSNFMMAAIETDHFYVSYAGDRQGIAEWLLEWKLRM